MLDTISPQDRRDAERARRIARAESTGNGGPPLLAPLAEIEAIGQLLYGRRWTQEVAEDLGEDPRQIRRWRSGEATVPDRALAWMRAAARRRARQIDALVGRDD